MEWRRQAAAAAALLAAAVCMCAADTCTEPAIVPSYYTTSDAVISSETVFIVEISLTCKNGAQNVALYADVNGKQFPVTRGQDGRPLPGFLEHRAQDRQVGDVRGEVLRRRVLQRLEKSSKEQRGSFFHQAALRRQRRTPGSVERTLGCD
ncbi:translocon-associated protein subunit delta isoform X1 [Heptranchias perlo]|uniref:translocon-associated protein subunit delta isoform X1 n=1 Tax=Heptranchias perlo TaxID=212740 RepID=UPI00355A23A9